MAPMENDRKTHGTAPGEEKIPKKRYAAPKLTIHGTVQDLTKNNEGAVTDVTIAGSR